jgi:Bacterial membrane flanked domain.
MANLATGGRVISASYRITGDALHFASGVVSSREEMVPLWAVRDVDLVQTIAQKARGVADLHLKIDPMAGVFGQAAVILRSIRDARAVRNLLLQQANAVRAYWNQRRHDMEIERQRASASQISQTFAPTNPAPAALPAAENLMAQLTKLGEMKIAGLLTDEEFAAAKAKLLG